MMTKPESTVLERGSHWEAVSASIEEGAGREEFSWVRTRTSAVKRFKARTHQPFAPEFPALEKVDFTIDS